MGVGGTLIGASLSKRNALGIDLSSKFITAYKKACKELKLKEQLARRFLFDFNSFHKLIF